MLMSSEFERGIFRQHLFCPPSNCTDKGVDKNASQKMGSGEGSERWTGEKRGGD